jgi:hypothetical protein
VSNIIIIVPVIQTIASFYFATFPTNFRAPRYQVFTNAHAVCAAGLDRRVSVYKVELVTDARCIGCKVTPNVSEVHLDCAEPTEKTTAPAPNGEGGR